MLPLYAVDRPDRRAVVTWALIGANLTVFLGELITTNGLDPCLSSQLFYRYGLVPYSVANGVKLTLQCSTGNLYPSADSLAPLTLLTSMFVHAGYLHIAGNMLFFFVFGGNIEARLGRGRYLAFYLACGLAAGLTMMGTSLAAGLQASVIPSIGASGAISGVMAAYLVLYPRTPIITWLGYFIIPVRAFWFILFWFGLQLLYQLGGIDTGTAYAAHIGGFVLGLVLAAAVKFTSKPEES